MRLPQAPKMMTLTVACLSTGLGVALAVDGPSAAPTRTASSAARGTAREAERGVRVQPVSELGRPALEPGPRPGHFEVRDDAPPRVLRQPRRTSPAGHYVRNGHVSVQVNTDAQGNWGPIAVKAGCYHVDVENAPSPG